MQQLWVSPRRWRGCAQRTGNWAVNEETNRHRQLEWSPTSYQSNLPLCIISNQSALLHSVVSFDLWCICLLLGSLRPADAFCWSGNRCALFRSIHLHIKLENLQALKSTQRLSKLFPLICAENKLDVIILPLRSQALAKIRELCQHTDRLVRSPTPPWRNGEQCGCQTRWWVDIRTVPHDELKQMGFNTWSPHFSKHSRS